MDTNLAILHIVVEAEDRIMVELHHLFILADYQMEQRANLAMEEEEDDLAVLVPVLVAEVAGMEDQEPVVPVLAHFLVEADLPLSLVIQDVMALTVVVHIKEQVIPLKSFLMEQEMSKQSHLLVRL